MTSRQRLLAAMRRQEVDRIPVSLYEFHRFGGCWAAEEPSYAPLLDLQQEMGDPFVFAPGPSGLLGDPHSIRNALNARSTAAGADRGSRAGETTVTIETPKGPLVQVSRMDSGIATRWTLKHFIEQEEDIGRFLSIPYSFTPPNFGELRTLKETVGEGGVLNFSIGDPLGNIVGLCDFEYFITRIATDPGLVRELLSAAARFLSDSIDWICSRMKEVCFRFWGPEYCGAPLMDPRRFFRPLVVDHVAPLVDRVHAGGGLAILHCHGRLDAIVEMIAETGADVLEPLEILPVATADVTMADVKRRVGDRMCLAGGMQALDLDSGTPALVRDKVRALIREGGPEGLIILPTSTPLSVPLGSAVVENYRAMFEEAREASA